VLVLAFCAALLAGVCGQALSPTAQLVAIVRYHRAPKRLVAPRRPDRRGLVLDHAPNLDVPGQDTGEPELELEFEGRWGS